MNNSNYHIIIIYKKKFLDNFSVINIFDTATLFSAVLKMRVWEYLQMFYYILHIFRDLK